MRLIRPRWARVKEFLWRAFFILLAAWFVLGAVGALVDYWRVHTVYIEGVVIFGTSLVVWIIAMLVSRDPKEFGGGPRFAIIFWTGLVWIIAIGWLAFSEHCDGSLAEYLHLGQLEQCTGP